MSKFSVVAIGVDENDMHVAFFKCTPALSQEDAQAYKDWLVSGPRLKFAIESDLYNKSNVVRIVYHLDTV